VNDRRTRIVEQGYDVIADTFVQWRDRIVDDPRRAWADELASRLSDGARILELGCGAGVPDTLLLAERFRVTGVDISREQIARARANVPQATFIQADFTALDLEPGEFDAVAAFYSFNHVPRDLLAGLFERIHTWLVEGGFFLTALGTSDSPGWTGDFLGAPTFFSSFPPDTNRRLLGEAGFKVELDQIVTLVEPEGNASFQWILGRA
jgi:cyclopropane fatty-acyl-phospholipid synthase-like methyltransferase